MSFNYNEGGQEYQFAAMPRPPIGEGILQSQAIHMIQLAEKLAQDAAYGKDIRQLPLNFLMSALERLEGMLLIAERLIREISSFPSVLKKSAGSAPCLITLPSTSALIDFSSLIMHAAATVDILSKYYTGESNVNHDGHFRSSRGRIYNLQPPDIRADYLWSDLGQFENKIGSIFSGVEGFKGLRNAIAHEHSVLGLSAYSFSAHLLSEREVLIFDCEIEMQNKNTGAARMFPITRTMETVISLVSWIVCRASICYLTRTREGAILKHPSWSPAWGHEFFVPVWNNPLAIYSDFVSGDPRDEVYSTIRVAANGFQTKNLPLDRRVRDKVLDLSKY